MRARLTALLPVAVAALLIAFCLTGAPLYSSSSGSAAVDTQLDETCRSDSALTLPVPSEYPRAERQVAEIGRPVPFVQPAQRLTMVSPFLAGQEPRRLTLLAFDGADQNVTPPLAPLGQNEIAVSANNLIQLQTAIGETVAVDGALLEVTQTFDNVPFAPLPAFWCGFPQLFEPTAGGDLPPPFAIASVDTIKALPGWFQMVQYRVVDQPLTLSEAISVENGYIAAKAEWEGTFAQAGFEVPTDELTRVVDRAQAVRTTVERNLAPVTLTGAIAGAVVLIASSVLLARDRERELRLLAVRGVPPWRIGAHVAPPIAGAVAGGTIAGAALAWGAVTVFGPSSNLERSALARAAIWTAAAMVLAVVVVIAVVAVVGDGFVDRRHRRVHVRWPALTAVASSAVLAGVAFRRLDSQGGLRTFGVESRGGDLLAMGFPLFAVLAVTAVAGLIVGGVASSLRLTGRRLPRAIRLGWRRAVLQAGPLAAVVVSIALAAGCFSVANALAQGAERQLTDKAEVYVGSDLAVDVFDDVAIPEGWTAPTTLISKASVKWDGDRSDVVGVDRATFAGAARLRDDAADQPLAQLVESVAPDAAAESGGPLPAVAAGADVGVGDIVEVELPGGQSTLQVRVAAMADFFPGKKTGIPMFVVDRSALAERYPFAVSALVIKDPPADAVEQLHAAGVRTGVVLDADTAFAGSAYSALRWAYAPLATLGGLFAVVALALQLLVIAARRRQRQIANVVMRRSGFGRRHLWWASVIETGVPLIVGAVTGTCAAMFAASLSIDRLDPMPSLAPPAEFGIPWTVLAAIACAIPLWTAVIAGVIVRSTTSADPMSVMQGAV